MSIIAVLLFCACCVQAQDLISPNINILKELGKIKDLEEKLQMTEESQKTLVTDLTSKLEELRVKNEALEVALQTLQNENEVRKVAFSASLLASGEGHTGPYSSVETLIYKKVFTNAGNGYDSNTGIFTAPVKGVYFFRIYAFSFSGTTSAVNLYKNEEYLCSAYAWKPVSNANASNGIVLTLEKGDQMYTKLQADTWVYDNPGRFTTFGGFLLFPL